MKFGRAGSDEFSSTVVTDANIVPPCDRDRLLETRNAQARLEMQIRTGVARQTGERFALIETQGGRLCPHNDGPALKKAKPKIHFISKNPPPWRWATSGNHQHQRGDRGEANNHSRGWPQHGVLLASQQAMAVCRSAPGADIEALGASRHATPSIRADP
jgi:hypothetical protein